MFDIVYKNNEFIATNSGNGIGFANFFPDSACNLDEYLVTRWVAKAIVDVFELVKVNKQDGKSFIVAC